MSDLHTCSYFCGRPECTRAQRDELREQLAAVTAERDVLKDLLSEAVDDVEQVLREMEQMYGTSYRQDRIADQQDLLDRINKALSGKEAK